MTENTRQRAIGQEFLGWINIAREIVEDHFPAERTQPHNVLVIETARSLMQADRMERIEKLLVGLAGVRAPSKEN